MCGRYTLTGPPLDLANQLHLPALEPARPRYNIAPTQDVPAVCFPADERAPAWRMLRWGLVPSWAKDPAVGARMINARAETVAQKPSFRPALKKRRCLIVADGFYEWKKEPGGKQPYHIRMRDGRPFAFAGLWEHWEGPEGETIESCAIITTTPNALTRTVHDRMPVILPAEAYELWLDPETSDAAPLGKLLRPFPAKGMTAHPVSRFVNSPRNDDPRCIETAA